ALYLTVRQMSMNTCRKSMWRVVKMFKQKFRRRCKEALEESGYRNPQLFFERNGREYASYWGEGMRRMEVIFYKDAKSVHIYELKFLGR
ncbi:MAG: hypothetical protein ACI4TK_19385, partial [Agathobacter sp.]